MLGEHTLDHGGPQQLYCVQNVPGHSGLCIHKGNWPQIDSDGCILVGQSFVNTSTGQIVTNSEFTLNELMQKLAGIPEFTLIVS